MAHLGIVQGLSSLSYVSKQREKEEEGSEGTNQEILWPWISVWSLLAHLMTLTADLIFTDLEFSNSSSRLTGLLPEPAVIPGLEEGSERERATTSDGPFSYCSLPNPTHTAAISPLAHHHINRCSPCSPSITPTYSPDKAYQQI